jgi:hypothetical protein
VRENVCIKGGGVCVCEFNFGYFFVTEPHVEAYEPTWGSVTLSRGFTVCVCDFNFGYFLSQKTQKRHRTFMCVV